MGCIVWSMSVTDFIVSCNFFHEQVCFQQQLFSYSRVGFSESCDMLCTAEGLEPAPGALLGWSVCVPSCGYHNRHQNKNDVFSTSSLALGKSMWWKDRNSSRFHQGPQKQFPYPFSSKHVIQRSGIICEQVQNNHDAINCHLGTWSHSLKDNQHLSAGYMIRKLVIADVHDSRRRSAWRSYFKAVHVCRSAFSLVWSPPLSSLTVVGIQKYD